MEAVIEAILFTMGESVELKKIAAAIEHDEATTRKIIHRLQDKYEAEDRGLVLLSWKTPFSCARRERCMTISFVLQNSRRNVS